MRILLLNQFYKPDTAATAQLMVDLAAEMVAAGHEVHVIASSKCYGGGETQHPAEEIIDGVNIHRVGATGFGRGGFIGRICDYLSFYILSARRAMKLPNIDVCIALTTPPFIALVGSRLARKRGTKLVHWAMDLYPQLPVAFGMIKKGSLIEKFCCKLERKIFKSSAAVISLGEVMTTQLIKAGCNAKKITDVDNWVPGEAVSYITPQQSETATLLYSGNLGMGHELETAVEAISKIEDRSKLKVKFVGNGKLKPQLQQQVEKLELTDCVEFFPPRPLNELSKNLASGDIHLISQRPGTQGLLVPSKLYGTLAAGRAAIYVGPEDTEVAAILKKHNAGLIVPPGQADATAQAITTLIENPQLRQELGQNALQCYRENFGRENSVKKIIAVIENL